MSKANKNIEDLFREKLDNHESIVRPDLWSSISSSLPAATSTATAIALKTKILIGIAASVITASTIFYFNNKNQSAQHHSPQKTEQAAPSTNTENASAVASDSINLEINTAAATNNPKAVSVNANAQAPTIPIVDVEDRVNTDLQNLNLYYARTSSHVEATEQTTEIAPVIEKVEQESSNAASKDQAQPLVMQVKEVDNRSLLYFFFSPQSANSFEWWIDDKLMSTNPTFSHSFEEEGAYTIKFVSTDINGRKLEKVENLDVIKNVEFDLPNAFSPNGDGTNDVFDIVMGVRNQKSIDRLIVRDKNGNTLFESSNNFIWDGTDKSGNRCDAGTYTYILSVTDKKNKPQMKAGTLQLFTE